jgi:hypothetical protein
MTDIKQQIEAAMADPVVQSKLRTLHALRCADRIDDMLYAISTAMVRDCAWALERGDTIEQVNEQLASEYMPWLEQWRVQTRGDLLRQLNEPDAQSHALQ